MFSYLRLPAAAPGTLSLSLNRSFVLSSGLCTVYSLQSVNFAVCNVQCVVSTMQCAACSVWVCSVQCAVCSVQCAVCSVLFSVTSHWDFQQLHPEPWRSAWTGRLYWAVVCVQYIVSKFKLCSVQCGVLSVQCVVCSEHCAVCSVHCTVCSVLVSVTSAWDFQQLHLEPCRLAWTGHLYWAVVYVQYIVCKV